MALTDDTINKLTTAIDKLNKKLEGKGGIGGSTPPTTGGGDTTIEALAGNLNSANGALGGMALALGQTEVATAAVVTDLKKHAAALLQGETSLSAHADIVGKNIEGLTKNNKFLKFFGDSASGAANYLIGTYNTYKNLSASGASLNGDLVDLRITAANTRMNLDEFADVVTNNASQLSALGAGVSGGTKAFANMSKAFFDSGASEEMFALGISAKEQNELLLEQMTINRRRNRTDQMSQGDLIRSTQAYVAELDVIAKLTGKNRKEMQEDSKARMRDGATQAKLRLLERQGITNAAETYKMMDASAAKLGPGFQDLLKDYVQMGVPLTDATKKLAASSPEAARLLSEAANEMKKGNKDAAIELTKQAEAAALKQMNSTQGLTMAAMGQLGGVAEVAAGTLKANQDLLDQVTQQGKIVAGVNDNLTSFGNALDGVVKKLKQERDDQLDNQVVAGFAATEQVLKDTAASATEEILTESKTAIESIGNAAKEALSPVNRSDIDPVMETLTGAVSSIVPGVDGVNNEVLRLQTILNTNNELSDQQRKVIEETINALQIAKDASTNATTADEKVKAEELTQKLLEGSKNLRGNNPEMDDQGSWLNATTNAIKEGIKGLWDMLPGFDEGTDGFKDFGKGTLGILHDLEQVVPKDSPQGALLSAFPGGLNQAMAKMQASMPAVTAQAQTAMASAPQAISKAVSGAGGGDDLVKSINEKLDTLNNNVLQLVEINNRTADYGKRQVREMKNVTGSV